MRKLFLVGVVIFLTACTITRTARLYDLDTGQVLHATMATHGTGHGEVTVVTPDGKTLTGEYSTVSNGQFSSSSANAMVNVGGTFGWANAQGFSVTRSSAVVGSGVVTGSGIVLEVVFQVDSFTKHGDGVGRDNKGHKYRLEF
jgi:hypothetical protein